MPTIGYDFDGVLCDIMPAFHLFWQRRYNFTMLQGMSRTFYMPMPEGYNEKKIYEDILEAINLYQAQMLPHAYAIRAVKAMTYLFLETPLIITARNPATEEVTRLWLDYWFGDDYELIFSGGGTHKAGKVKKLGIDYFVEDRFRTVGQLADVCKKVYMPDREWNTDREHRGFDNIFRVNNLLDVQEDILADMRG